MVSAKPPLTPYWAVVLSLVASFGGLIAVAAAHLLLDVPLTTALSWYALVAYCAVTFSWAALDARSHRVTFWATNGFMLSAVCVFGVVAVVQDDYQAFPAGAALLVVLGGVAALSVIGVHAVRNFIRWRRGELDGHHAAVARTERPDEVYLVSRNLETATAADVDRAEERLGCHFLPGYREYITRFGLGTYTCLIRIYLPDKTAAPRASEAR
jgi:hypothetical protein